MTPEIWTVLLILNKFLVYLGIAGAIGGCINMFLFTNRDVSITRYDVIRQWQIKNAKYALLFIVIGFIANFVDFFVQTGNLSETGLAGMFEPVMLNMMWVSSVGTMTIVRAQGLALSGAMMLYMLLKSTSLQSYAQGLGFIFLSFWIISTLSYSFTLSGHTNTLTLGSITLISLHVAMGFAWLGSLLPLIYATYVFDDKELHILMHRFGTYASWGVAILLAVGIVMLFQLVPSIDLLLSSPYGQLFMLKILFVLVLLLFAILHKFLLVPRILQQSTGRATLRYSVIGEAFIALFVLVSTSVVTTAVGPIT